jgi:anti-sigma regulatory factor (Ser/Thr protein kinase)
MTQVDVSVGDHVLLLYERDGNLVDDVSGLLADGLEKGETVVVIATADHRDAIRTRLGTTSWDANNSSPDTHFFEFDAAETLGRLMSDERLDPAKFREVVGSVVRKASLSGRPVRAYGEMVTLLWEAGDVLPAVELEMLWNELQEELDFSLVCAYPTSADSADELTGALGEVCNLHSSAIGPTEVTARFMPAIDSPRAARHLLVETLREWGCTTDLVNDGAIVITELAGNVVNHVREPFLVTIALKSGTVRISVRDPSALAPVPAKVGISSLSGRGLSIVEAVACRWGVSIDSDHKTVWTDLAVPDVGP